MSALISRTERCTELLAALVAIDTSNPMGRPCAKATPIERQAIVAIEELFEPFLHRVKLTRQRCSPLHESLVIEWPVDGGSPPGLFESHIDTVPADTWEDRAWLPQVGANRLTGLGACDDKASLTAMLIAMLELLEQGVEPPRSLILVCAGDEEYAQAGIKHFLKEYAGRPAYGIFGEPTQLCPVIQHKGTVRWDITVHGRGAHTSRPELGINAITGMMDVIAELRLYQEMLHGRSTNKLLTGPTITITQIHGGRTRNATPDECTVAVDFRVVPGMDPADEREALIEHLTSLPWDISHSSVQLITPPLNTHPDSPFSERVLEICREVVDPKIELQGAPYGTDAAWAGCRCPSIVLGPGDIRYAHAVDEQIALAEVAAATEIYRRIMMDAHEESA